LIRLLVYLLMIGMIIIVPCVELAIHVLIKDDWYWKILSVLYLCTIPFCILSHTVLTEDFRFTPINKLLGRDSKFYTVQYIALYFNALVFYGSQNCMGILTIPLSLLSFATSLMLMILFVQSDYLFHFKLLSGFKDFALSLYILESLIQFINHCSGHTFSTNFDTDFLLIIFTPGIALIVSNLMKTRFVHMVLEFDHKNRRTTVETAELLRMEYLFYLFNNISSDSRCEMLAYTWVHQHSQHCTNPYCYCFALKVNYDIRTGVDAAKIRQGHLYGVR
jgi:hypothetical protein